MCGCCLVFWLLLRRHFHTTWRSRIINIRIRTLHSHSIQDCLVGNLGTWERQSHRGGTFVFSRSVIFQYLLCFSSRRRKKKKKKKMFRAFSTAMKKPTQNAFNKILSTSANMLQVAPMATYKTSTGLVGLAVDPNGRETLNALSQKVLDSVKVKMNNSID